MDFYQILKKNKFLCTDKRAKKLLKDKEYHLYADYGKDEKFVVWIPFIPVFETPIMLNLK